MHVYCINACLSVQWSRHQMSGGRRDWLLQLFFFFSKWDSFGQKFDRFPEHGRTPPKSTPEKHALHNELVFSFYLESPWLYLSKEPIGFLVKNFLQWRVLGTTTYTMRNRHKHQPAGQESVTTACPRGHVQEVDTRCVGLQPLSIFSPMEICSHSVLSIVHCNAIDII